MYLAGEAAVQLYAAGTAVAVFAATGARFDDHVLVAATAHLPEVGVTCVAAPCSGSLLLFRCR